MRIVMQQTKTARTPSIGEPNRPPTISRAPSARRGPRLASAPPPAPNLKPAATKMRWSVSLFVFAVGIAFGAGLCIFTLWCIAQFTGR
jgi:hypothetical protein